MQEGGYRESVPGSCLLGAGTEDEGVAGLLLADPALPAQSYSSCSAVASSPPKCCREETCSGQRAKPGQEQEKPSAFTAELVVSNLEVSNSLQPGEHPFRPSILEAAPAAPVAVRGSPVPAGLDGPRGPAWGHGFVTTRASALPTLLFPALDHPREFRGHSEILGAVVFLTGKAVFSK